MKKWNAKWFALPAMIILLVVAHFYGGYHMKRANAEKDYQELREETTKEKETGIQPKHDFQALQGKNADIYGWITVPGTDVDYPILQGEEDNFYLSHDIEGNESIAGAVYSNSCNVKDMEDGITILYGHELRNGKMFSTLHNFDDKEFFDQHEELTVEMPEELRTYRVFGVYNYNDNYIPAMYSVTEEQGVEEFIASLDECAKEEDSMTHVREKEKLLPSDKVLVLSTCIASQPDRRFLVVAKLDKVTPYQQEEEQ